MIQNQLGVGLGGVKLFLKISCSQFVDSDFCRRFTPSNNNNQKTIQDGTH